MNIEFGEPGSPIVLNTELHTYSGYLNPCS